MMMAKICGILCSGMAVCDRKIALLIFQAGEIEPHDENPGIDHCGRPCRQRFLHH